MAVVALLALTLLAHGALLLARQEVAASTAAARLVGARAAGESAVLEALALSKIVPDSTGRLRRAQLLAESRNGVEYRATSLVLGRETYLLEGVGRVAGGPWGPRVGRLAWVMDPLARVGASAAVVEVATGAPVEILGALVPGAQDWRIPGRAECDGQRGVLDSIFAEDRPSVAEVPSHPRGEPSLGRLAAPTLLSSFRPLPATSGTPAPAVSWGRCSTEDVWNWGDPEDASAPCGGHRVGRSAFGSLRLESGVGQGVLVVEGSLELVGTHFRGLILTGGAVHLTAGARVEGLLRASGGIRVDADSGVILGGCSALAALEAVRDPLSAPTALAAGWIQLGTGLP